MNLRRFQVSNRKCNIQSIHIRKYVGKSFSCVLHSAGPLHVYSGAIEKTT